MIVLLKYRCIETQRKLFEEVVHFYNNLTEFYLRILSSLTLASVCKQQYSITTCTTT